MTPDMLLLIVTCALLVIAIAVYVARTPLGLVHLKQAAAVVQGLAGTYLRNHPQYQDPTALAGLIAGAYDLLPPTIQRIVPPAVFVDGAEQLIALLEAALMQPPPANAGDKSL